MGHCPDACPSRCVAWHLSVRALGWADRACRRQRGSWSLLGDGRRAGSDRGTSQGVWASLDMGQPRSSSPERLLGGSRALASGFKFRAGVEGCVGTCPWTWAPGGRGGLAEDTGLGPYSQGRGHKWRACHRPGTRGDPGGVWQGGAGGAGGLTCACHLGLKDWERRLVISDRAHLGKCPPPAAPGRVSPPWPSCMASDGRAGARSGSLSPWQMGTLRPGDSRSHLSWWGAEAGFQLERPSTRPGRVPGAAGVAVTRRRSSRPAVFDFHQAVDGLQEVQRQAQEGKK